MQTEGAAPQRALIERALADGDRVAALSAARRLWAESPDGALARFLTARIDSFWDPADIMTRRIAILRSFTVEPVLPFLAAEAALSACRLDIRVGDFNSYGQEILDDGGPLYAHRPDIVIVAIQARDLAPALWSTIADLPEAERQAQADAAADLLERLLAAFRSRSSASLIVHGMERPARGPEGLLGDQKSLGQDQALEVIDRRLRSWCAANADAFFLDYAALQARLGRDNWGDERKWAAARLPLSVAAMPRLARLWWRYVAALALPPAKVLALDLDNSLWGGVIGEDGMEGIILSDEMPGLAYRNFQRCLLDIAARGILLTVVSKNNPDDALRVLERHPHMLVRPDRLAAMRINWESKVDNLMSLAAELRLGLDSFIFVDDSPAECEAVRRALPEVEVVELPADPAEFESLIRDNPRLERLKIVDEDIERTRYYAEERQRREVRDHAGNLESFLASLEIRVDIRPISAATLARAAQLTQKTNQFNLTTRRYTEAQLADQLSDANWSGYTLEARDRFGPNGIVGLALLHHDGRHCEIESFLLSCRVIGRGIEMAFLSAIADVARSRGATRLGGWYRPTRKNAPAAAVYRDAGFRVEREEEQDRWWVCALDDASLHPPGWIELGERPGDASRD